MQRRFWLGHLALFCCVGAMTIGALPASSAWSRDDRTPRRATPLLDKAIKVLVAEAETARSVGAFAHPKADFNTRCVDAPPSEEVFEALVTRRHDDPFIDAYVRWQLTSFDPPWREFEDRAFLRFMEEAPPMVENPRAERGVLNLLQQAERAAPLRPDATDRLRQFAEDVATRAMIAEEMNRPAIEFREWVTKKLGETGQRPRQWMVERLAASIVAGWPVRDIKADISRALSASVADDTFTPAQRRELIMLLSRLVGDGRSSLDEITYYANGMIRVTYQSSRVTTENVDNWRKRLAGLEGD